MSLHKVSIDVHAQCGDKPPVYRVYVDNNLLTERSFIWSGTTTFIREHLLVELEPGSHTVHVEQYGNNGTITGKNVLVDLVASSNEFVITE